MRAPVIRDLKLAGILSIAIIAASASSETLTPEPDDETYNFVTHYRVEIDASVEKLFLLLPATN